ncbi:phosphorothioated DNA-binding restriction endonuclease [Caballeronia sp. ATUFL_M2_KS44]|uniref:phosphorothioated DNA-binding restriction endonuclease n=1 Tax=Caballeronia sp. ATUFL_M2_KS44 TaxID=2921767 RepID=UPI0020290DB2|nr:HNH endonuclease [Caballeronia sp. ATUFL_M2_KS44]
MKASHPPDILQRFDALKVWQRGDERAPHKPLLALLALGLYRRGIHAVPFVQYESKLNELLREFGPSRRTLYPEMPFLRLQSDDVWQVQTGDATNRIASNADLGKTQLRRIDAIGRFSDDVQRVFDTHPQAIGAVARMLLNAHFADSMHEDILAAVGLSLDEAFDEAPERGKTRRDPEFRDNVLRAYQYRCALCNWDMRICNRTIGLEAAHIKWFQYRGPDVVENGIALCCLHHKLFDMGAFTLADDRRVLVSEDAHGTEQFEHILLRHHGGQLNAPVRLEHHPSHSFVSWHRAQVFRGRARPF